MQVLDANAAPVGQVQEVQDGAVLIRLQLEIAVPFDVIHEIRDDRVVLDGRTEEWTPLLLGVEEVRPPAARGQVCCACGAIEGTDKAVYYLRKKDAWFCGDCWRALPQSEVAHLVQEAALRGVPFS
jgi:hypothetical protein